MGGKEIDFGDWKDGDFFYIDIKYLVILLFVEYMLLLIFREMVREFRTLVCFGYYFIY